MRTILATILLLITLGTVTADEKNPNYQDDAMPIFKQHCFSCHGLDNQKADLDLSSYANMMLGGSSGEVITAGDADGSRLYKLTAHVEKPEMPPKADKIPEAQLAILKLWIEQGARENSGSKAMVKAKTNIGLAVVSKGKPDGPPPMPEFGKLALEPVIRGRRPNSVIALATSPWAPLVAVGAPKQVLLYDTDNGLLMGVLPFEAGQINSLKFSANGKLLLAAGGVGGASGKAILYNVETGAIVTSVGDIETDAILAADISPDQSIIAVGTPTKVVRGYSTADGSVLYTIKKHTDWVTAVEFSPDGVLLATGDRNGGLFVWEGTTGREFHTLNGHTAMITDLSWRGDSNVLASASEDTTVKLWGAEEGNNIKSWGAHGGGTQDVDFAHDGNIATTGRDRVAKWWDGNGKQLKQFPGFADIGLQVGVIHDDKAIVTGDWTGTVIIYELDGKLRTSFNSNPLALNDRLAEVGKRVAEAEAQATASDNALSAANKRVVELTQQLQAAKENAAKIVKDVNDTKQGMQTQATVLTTLQAELKQAQTLLNQQKESAKTAKNAVAEKVAAVRQAEAKLQQARVAAAKDAKNVQLAEAVKTNEAAVAAMNAERDAAQKVVTDSGLSVTKAGESLKAIQTKLTETATQLKTAKQRLPQLEKQMKPSAEAVPATQKQLDDANAKVAPAKVIAEQKAAEVKQLRALLQKMQAVAETAKK